MTHQPRKPKPGKLRILGEKPVGLLRVVFYLRVSPDESLEDGEETTIGNQRDYLHDRYRVEFGPHARTPMQFVGEYVDDQITGTIPLVDRPAGAAMLAAAARREFDAVIVLKIDRFGRTATYILDAAETLEELGIGFISSVENVNTTAFADPLTAANAKFFFTIMAALAELDRATFLGRTSLGRRRHAKAGRHGSGPVPFGYEVNAEGMLVESTRPVAPLGITEADLVRDIFRKIADGMSCGDVAQWLNRAGVPAVTRYYHKNAQQYHDYARSGRWYTSRISRMIDDEKHAGTRTRQIMNEEFINELGFEIVDPVLRARAQAEMANPKRHKGRKLPDSEGYLLRGLLVCTSPECMTSSTTGRPHVLTGYSLPRRTATYRYYRCSGRTHSGSKFGTPMVCTMPQLNAHDAENAVLDELERRVRDSQPTIDALEATVNERLGITADGSAGRREALSTRLAELQRARLNIRQNQLAGALSAEEALEDLQANAAQMAQVKHYLDLLSGQEELAAIERQRLTDARSVLDDLAAEWDELRAAGGLPLRQKIERLVRQIDVIQNPEGGIRFVAHLTFEPVRPHAADTCMSEQSGHTGLPSAALALTVSFGLRAA